jgi:hypothetical protein
MGPLVPTNWLAVVASVVASFALGALWYGPLFGRAWRKAMGFLPDERPPTAEIARGSLLNLLGTFLVAFFLTHDMLGWKPPLPHVSAGYQYLFVGGVTVRSTFKTCFVVWLGFVVPMLLNGVAYERKSWRVFAIAASYQFVSLQMMGAILSNWPAQGA